MADLIRAVRAYVDRMLKPRDKTTEISGMKVLLLDRETKAILGMVYSMHEILEKEVFLVESIDAGHEDMLHLKAVVFVRPTKENLAKLRSTLKEPKFAEYHIFFSNIVGQDFLRQLAEADVKSSVKQVQEFYGDYYAVNPDYFTLNLGQSLSLCSSRARWSRLEDLQFERATQGLVSVLLSLKFKPYVRFQGTSEVAQVFARKVSEVMGGERELFQFGRSDGAPLLLVLDRREDPVTPLLSQWTYQAQVHELLKIDNNTVSLKDAPGITKELREVVLSTTQDAFFRSHMYANYGDLNAAIKAMLEEYASERKSHENITSIEDMQRFVGKYPELRAKNNIVSKHVALASELSRIVDRDNLLAVSELEQDIACRDAQSEHFGQLCAMIDDPSIGKIDVLRCVMLFALRYETDRGGRLEDLKAKLRRDKGLGSTDVALIDAVLAYGGVSSRGGDLFGKNSMMAKLSTSVKRGLKGVENVYTQHKPVLSETIDQLAKNKLSKTLFPYAGPEMPPNRLGTVIVFIVGGATFEEAAAVAALNATGRGPRVILGGTQTINSKSFLHDLSCLGGTRVEVGHGGAGAGAGSSMYGSP